MKNITLYHQEITTSTEAPKFNILFFHDIFQHLGQFEFVKKYFQKECELTRLIFFDLSGHGLSSGNRYKVKGLDKYVDDSFSIFNLYENKSLEATSWIFIGIGLGADIATLLATKLFNSNILLKKIILINPYRYFNFNLNLNKLFLLKNIKLILSIRSIYPFFLSDEYQISLIEQDFLINKFIYIPSLIELVDSYKKNTPLGYERHPDKIVYIPESINTKIPSHLFHKNTKVYNFDRFILNPFAGPEKTEFIKKIIEDLY